MKKAAILLFLIITIQSSISAQRRIGSWKSYLPYSNAAKLVIAGDKVYCSTAGGLFYYDKTDLSVGKISKENGLSDTEISAIGYSDFTGSVVIAYTNGNVDIIQNNQVYNIPDIMKNTQILGDKRIYNISVDGGTAYLCSGFGIIVLNLEKKEFSETYKIGEGGAQVKVNDFTFTGSGFFAATDQGIYIANRDAPNLLDYQYWKRDTQIPNYNKKFNAIKAIGDRVYASYQSGIEYGDAIYYFDGFVWTTLSNFIADNSFHLSSWDQNLVVSGLNNVHIFSATGERTSIYINSPKCAFIDHDNVLWAADSENGLIRRPINEDSPMVISPNGPSTIYVSDIKISKDILYTVPGGPNSGYNNLFRTAEINIFKNNNWKGKKVPGYGDYYRIAIDPVDPEHYYIGSWGYGLSEFKNDSLINVYKDNSSLQTIIPGDYYRLGGMAFDKSGNLWITNAGVPKPLSVLTKDGEWASFNLNNLANLLYVGDIIVSASGYKWMIQILGSRGLLVFDDNETIDNPDDDRAIKLDIKDENDAIITNDVYSIAEDHDGNIWLGTNKGVLVYYNPAAVFDGENFNAQHINVPRNDGTPYGDYLLVTETVTSIAIDGANRKWLGTKNAGVSLVSDDGLKQIYNFTSENSPLLSNSVTSIAINDKNGEVFFGTDKGIISFTAEATGPSENFDSLFVYPNPVRETFTGDISITGLLDNTTVKVTDLNGNLVFETLSLGGQALWDGKNFRGERVGTGVYLVFCSSEDGALSRVTKLLFIH